MTRPAILVALDEWLERVEGDFVAQVEAQKFVAWAHEHRGAELLDYLVEAAPSIFTNLIARRDTAARTRARLVADSVRFREAVEAGEIDTWQISYVIDDSDTRRRLGDMTGADHRFVAAQYTTESNRQKLFAAFHVAVAKKVGARRTADVFTEEQYLALQASILKRAE